MRGFLTLMTVAAIVTMIVVFVIFPTLQADVNRSAADARYAKQQELLAQAEIERARAVTVSAKGEADALRMSINQPVVIMAIGTVMLLSIITLVLVSLYIMRQQELYRERHDYGEQQAKTVTVYINGRTETLFVPDGMTPAMVAQRYLAQFDQRSLVVMDGW